MGVPRLFALALLAGALLGGSLPFARADADLDRLRHLASPDHASHEKAMAWWEGLTDANKVALLRRALAGEDEALADVAARAIGVAYLDPHEIRRAMRRLHRTPLALVDDARRAPWGMGSYHGAGAPDVIPFWRAVVAGPGLDPKVSGTLDVMHRVLRSAHVEGLLPLLEAATGIAYERLLWTLALAAEYDREDQYRAVVARGLLYAVRREHADAKVPKLADVEAHMEPPEGGGLPATFVELAEAWRTGEDKDPLGARPFLWLERWAVTLTPAPRDAAVLRHVVDEAERTGKVQTLYLHWAMRHLVRFPGASGRDLVVSWCEGEDDIAACAAAALAEHGDPKPFDKLLETVNTKDRQQIALLETLLWAVDRPRARERAVRKILADDPPGMDDDGELGPTERVLTEKHSGIVIDDADLDWIEAELWKRDAPLVTLLWFHGHVRQGRIRDGQIERLLSRLESSPALDWEYRNLADLVPVFATLERRDPAGFRRLLTTWLDTQPAVRNEVLLLLARLGDAHHVGAMLAAWSEWDDEGWVLGRVKHPVVTAFLRTQAASEDQERAVVALQALVAATDLPSAARQSLSVLMYAEDGEADLDLVRELVVEGRVIEAVLHLAADAEVDVHRLGTIDDERARALLQRLRMERHSGLYYEATAGLAIAGDPEARADLDAFLDDDRIWAMRLLPEDLFCHFEPAYADRLLDRLDSNCCLGWRAMVFLKERFPTIPFDTSFGGAGTRHTRGWLEATRWVHSPLTDGLVPLGR